MPDSLRASGVISASVLLSRILGLVREVAFAALFGAGALADAFQVAFRIPNLLRDLLAEGALSSAFVPTFTATLRQDGSARAYVLGNLVLCGVGLVTGGLTLLGVLFPEPIVLAISDGFGGDPQKVAQAAELTRLMMPVLMLVSLGAVWMGMLNAQRRFVVPALAPALFNVVSLAAAVLVWLLGKPVDAGILVWSSGVVAAALAQALVQLIALWRLGYRPRIAFRGLWRHPGVRRIVRLMGPAVLGLAAIQINVFVNTRFASSLGDGAVAQLSYAFRIFFLPLGMFGVALATVTTTSVSEAAAVGDPKALASRTVESVRAAWMLTTASAVGLCVLADPIVELIYLHGRVTADDADAIAVVLQAYLIGLLPYSVIKILAPGYYAVDRPRVAMWASASGVAANITFNALTYRTLGPPGIALGTAVGATVNVLVLRLWFGRCVARLPTTGLARQLSALVVANALMGACVWYAWELVIWGQAAAAVLRGSVATAAALCAVIMAAFVVYAGSLSLFGYPGARRLWMMPRRLWARLRPKS